ncbi:Uncharacterised protein [Vibrio cholerae]|uniref:Uncharacterized protein n=1 Tax=Vibrio cholerae TaxID=666 RepID=A0A655ZUA7_VIBCL|nr:Uncharacterised protein [Vibrio cholerae]
MRRSQTHRQRLGEVFGAQPHLVALEGLIELMNKSHRNRKIVRRCAWKCLSALGLTEDGLFDGVPKRLGYGRGRQCVGELVPRLRGMPLNQ